MGLKIRLWAFGKGPRVVHQIGKQHQFSPWVMMIPSLWRLLQVFANMIDDPKPNQILLQQRWCISILILMTVYHLWWHRCRWWWHCLPHRRLPVLSRWESQFTDASYFFLITLATCLAFTTSQPSTPIDRGKSWPDTGWFQNINSSDINCY